MSSLQTIQPNSPRTRAKLLAKGAADRIRSKPFTRDENTTPAVKKQNTSSTAKRSLSMSRKSSSSQNSSKRRRTSAKKRGSPNPFSVMSIMNDITVMTKDANRSPPSDVTVAANLPVPAQSTITATSTAPPSVSSKKKKKRSKSGKKKKKTRPAKMMFGMGILTSFGKELAKQTKTPPGTPADLITFGDSNTTTVEAKASAATSTTTSSPAIATHAHSPAVSSPMALDARRQSFSKIQNKTSRRLSGVHKKENTGTPDNERAKWLAQKNQLKKQEMSLKMKSPADKIRIRKAQAKKNLMKSQNRLQFEKDNGIDTSIPSPVDRRASFGAVTLPSSTTKSTSLPASSASSASPASPAFLVPTVAALASSSPNEQMNSPSSQGSFTWSEGDMANAILCADEDRAMLKMQKIVRGYLQRVKFQRVLKTFQQNRAAVMVQKVRRGFVARKQVKAIIIQKQIEINKIKRIAAEKKRKELAAASQKILQRRENERRRSLERQEQERLAIKQQEAKQLQVTMQHNAAITIASTFKKYMLHKNKAAVQITSAIRHYVFRQSVSKSILKIKASITIQSCLRKSNAYKTLLSLRVIHFRKAMAVRKWKTSTTNLRHYNNTRKAAVTLIQAVWRGNYEINEYRAKQHSVLKIQCTLRCWRWKMKYPILLKNQRSCVRNWSSMSSQLTKRQQRRAIATARQTIKQNLLFVALQTTSSILIQKNFRLKLQRQAYLNVLETTRLAIEDERSHHAEEYYQMELDVAEAERIRDLRSTTITKRGTGTVSISEFHVVKGHVEYTLKVKLNTTEEIQGETKSETKDDRMETTSVEGSMSTRYSEIFSLHSLLCENFRISSTNNVAPITMPTMPPKTWCKNTNLNFLTRRKENLTIYLNQLLSNDTIVRSWPMRQFFGRLQLNA